MLKFFNHEENKIVFLFADVSSIALVLLTNLAANKK